jgi:hypothetical protein
MRVRFEKVSKRYGEQAALRPGRVKVIGAEMSVPDDLSERIAAAGRVDVGVRPENIAARRW